MKETVKQVKLLEPVDVDSITIKRDHYFRQAYTIDLPLDSTPDHAWQEIFEREWKSSRQLWDRKLFTMGDKLRLVTTANEIEEKLDWVKHVLAQTNKGVEEYNRETEAREAQMDEQVKKQILEKEAKVEEIRNVLRRVYGAA
jgi:hypothetical protein